MHWYTGEARKTENERHYLSDMNRTHSDAVLELSARVELTITFFLMERKLVACSHGSYVLRFFRLLSISTKCPNSRRALDVFVCVGHGRDGVRDGVGVAGSIVFSFWQHTIEWLRLIRV